MVTVDQDVGKSEPLSVAGGNAKWCPWYGKQYGGSWTKVKIEIPI